MRTAVLSDVHSNLEALQAVLDHLVADRIVVLGDIVGYNADPAGVVDALTHARAFLLAGNHDLAATGRFDVRWFNDVAAAAIEWTKTQLGADVERVLSSLEPSAHEDGRVLVHGSVRDPAAEYVRDTAHAAASFAAEDFDLGLFGHTHVPVAYAQRDRAVGEIGVEDGSRLSFERGVRYMLNPGSVGQPRDGDPRASYMIVDDGGAQWHRVAYDVGTTQRKVRDAGLPDVLAARLAVGK